METCGTVACVGIDPVQDKMPADMRSADAGAALTRFSDGVIDAVAGVVPIVKFQSGCYERYGEQGVAALRRAIAHARQAGLLVLLDYKRGDIGITAEHYAAAAYDGDSGADAVTYSGYLGSDTIEPVMRPGKGVFVLVRTSNPGSDGFQTLKLEDGRTVAEAMADVVHALGTKRVGACGVSDIGAVVGATKSAEAAALRKRMPSTMLLIPGYGAQGGTIADIRPALRSSSGAMVDRGVLVTASRSVIYPGGDTSAAWRANVAIAAKKLVEELRAL